MAWEEHHIQHWSLLCLQVPCHGPGLWCAADSVGPCQMETGGDLSIAMEWTWTWAKAWLVQLNFWLCVCLGVQVPYHGRGLSWLPDSVGISQGEPVGAGPWQWSAYGLRLIYVLGGASYSGTECPLCPAGTLPWPGSLVCCSLSWALSGGTSWRE